MKKIIFTILFLMFILNGCAISGITANGNFKAEYQVDKNFLNNLTYDFIKSYKKERNPLKKIIYCEKIANAYEEFLNKYKNQLSIQERMILKNRIYELNNKANTVIKEVNNLINTEKENLEYSRFQYEKKRAINDLKYVKRIIDYEKNKWFNYFGLQVDIKNAARAWKFCERVMRNRKVPEMLKIKAGDHKISLVSLMRSSQIKICQEFPDVKDYCEYKDYPNWDVEKAAILKYMEGDKENLEFSEKEGKKSIKIVSIN